MLNSPLISILLPFKNEEKYISECVESIMIQDYPNWELILVDDHSSDKSPAIVQAYVKKDPRIKLYLNKSTGVIAALSTALSKSSGELISRMDGDDYKSENNLSALASRVKKGTLAIGLVKYFRAEGIGDGYAFYESWINTVNISGNTWKEVYRECVIPSPCWLAYKEDLISAGGFDSKLYPEDYDLCFRFYKTGLKVQCTNEVIHFWRDHDIRTTRVSQHYSDNHFAHLKIHYFLQIDYNPDQELILVGAGKKAKKIAQLLRESETAFRWVTNNNNKIGHNIYGIILEGIETFKPTSHQQFIIAIANFEDEFTDSILPQNLFYFY